MAQKILIIDDDLYIRELYEELLKTDGFEVVTAIDGEDGLTKIQGGNFDLILLDVMMPKLDGLGVLAKIKDIPTKSNLNIVLLTNLANDQNVAEAIKNGQSKSCLIKSDMNPGEFVTKIKSLLPNN